MAHHADVMWFWSPRVVGLAFAGLVAVSSGGRFEGGSLFGTVTALLLQSAPAILALLLVVAAWRWAWFGAVAFLLLGVLAFTVGAGRPVELRWLAVPVMLLVTGLLFFGDWFHRRRLGGD